MNSRGQVGFVVALAAVALGVLWICSVQISAQQQAAVGEVTAVVDGDRAGTVVVHTVRHERAGAWRVADDGEVVEWIDDVAGAAGQPRTRQCAGRICYRVAGEGLRVEGSMDGGDTFSTAWELEGGAYTMLTANYPDLGDPSEHLSSRSLVVHPVSEREHVVFVANGRDGLLFRDVNDGWHRLGVPDAGEGCCFYAEPLSIDGGRGLARVAVPAGVVVGFVILLTGVVTSAVRQWWRAMPVVAVLAALGGVGTAVILPLDSVGMFPGWLYSVPTALAIVVGGSFLANWAVAAAAGPDPARRQEAA